MSDPMQEIRASFFVECEELLEALQDGLEALSDGGADAETINIVFRAVHSIKGGAGAFGLDALVGFAHIFETALDDVRDGRLTAGPDAMRLFFQGGDVLSDLIRAARDDAPIDADAIGALTTDLRALVGDAARTPEVEASDFQPMTIDLDFDFDAPAEAEAFEPDPSLRAATVTFRPAPELYLSGNEPYFFLRALSDLGPMQTLCRHDALPDLDDYDPASALLWWEIRLSTRATRAEILEVFEFAEGLCILELAMPGENDIPAAHDHPDTDAVAELPAPAAAPVALRDLAPSVRPDSQDRGQTAVAPKATVRVDLDRIDRLVNLVGELVINQAMLSQSVAAAGLAANSTVSTGLDEFLQLTRDIQESVMMIRAQPVKSLFQRMARIVRESSADVGKSVRLRTDGETTEIDKTVIERLADPLTHMIRNAVDHGLETPEARVAAGKSAEGRIVLSAAHTSGRVVIEVSDDGAGINRARVLRIAEEKGLIARRHRPDRRRDRQPAVSARVLDRQRGLQPLRSRGRHGCGADRDHDPGRAHLHHLGDGPWHDLLDLACR